MSEWMESAVCRQLDPELFFDPGMVEEAVMACREYCPVLAECREWAIRGNLEFGVVGGMSAPERRAAASAAGVPLPVVEPEHGTEAGASRHRRAGERACGRCRTAEKAARRARRARRAATVGGAS